jgi:hypothetical protein
LLLYTQTLDSLADAAAAATLLSNDLRGLRNPSPTLHAAAAFLLVATTLAMTPTGNASNTGSARSSYRSRNDSRSICP